MVVMKDFKQGLPVCGQQLQEQTLLPSTDSIQPKTFISLHRSLFLMSFGIVLLLSIAGSIKYIILDEQLPVPFRENPAYISQQNLQGMLQILYLWSSMCPLLKSPHSGTFINQSKIVEKAQLFHLSRSYSMITAPTPNLQTQICIVVNGEISYVNKTLNSISRQKYEKYRIVVLHWQETDKTIIQSIINTDPVLSKKEANLYSTPQQQIYDSNILCRGAKYILNIPKGTLLSRPSVLTIFSYFIGAYPKSIIYAVPREIEELQKNPQAQDLKNEFLFMYPNLQETQVTKEFQLMIQQPELYQIMSAQKQNQRVHKIQGIYYEKIATKTQKNTRKVYSEIQVKVIMELLDFLESVPPQIMRVKHDYIEVLSQEILKKAFLGYNLAKNQYDSEEYEESASYYLRTKYQMNTQADQQTNFCIVAGGETEKEFRNSEESALEYDYVRFLYSLNKQAYSNYSLIISFQNSVSEDRKNEFLSLMELHFPQLLQKLTIIFQHETPMGLSDIITTKCKQSQMILPMTLDTEFTFKQTLRLINHQISLKKESLAFSNTLKTSYLANTTLKVSSLKICDMRSSLQEAFHGNSRFSSKNQMNYYDNLGLVAFPYSDFVEIMNRVEEKVKSLELGSLMYRELLTIVLRISKKQLFEIPEFLTRQMGKKTKIEPEERDRFRKLIRTLDQIYLTK